MKWSGSHKILFPITLLLATSLSISNVNGFTTIKNIYFSTDVPDDWAYREFFFGVGMTPSEFGVILLNQTKPLDEKMKEEGAYASLSREWEYQIKNAPLDLFVKYKIEKQDKIQVTSKQNVTVDGEPAVKVFADGIESFNGTKFVEYIVMHDKEPYYLAYMANVNDYQKYLPQFEQMIKSFKFARTK